MWFPALVGLTLFAAPPAAPRHPAPAPLDDATIVAIFDAANGFDIETGTLGSTKGSSKEVRAVGASLVRDHQAVRQQGRDLAKRLGVTPTPPAVNPFAAQHAQALAELKAFVEKIARRSRRISTCARRPRRSSRSELRTRVDAVLMPNHTSFVYA